MKLAITFLTVCSPLICKSSRQEAIQHDKLVHFKSKHHNEPPDTPRKPDSSSSGGASPVGFLALEKFDSRASQSIHGPAGGLNYCQDNAHIKGQWTTNLTWKPKRSFYCCQSGNHTDNQKDFCEQGDDKIEYFMHGSTRLCSSTGRGCECENAEDRFRQDVLSPRELYLWKPSNCQLLNWSATSFCHLLNHRKVLMIGDSTMEQTATTLMSMITVGGGACAGDIAFARSDFLFLERFGLEFPFDEVVSRELPNIVILTAGAWLKDEGDMTQVLEYIGQHLMPKLSSHLTLAEQWRLIPRYIWKTQNPGHVDCQNFSAPITAAQEAQLNLSTTPSPHRWHLFPKFDKMAMAYLKQFNFKFIDMSPLYLRPDSHPGHLKDCLHICMPGPIDLFSTLFMQMLFNGEV